MSQAPPSSDKRYWRLYGLTAGSYNGGALCEIQMYTSVGGADVTTGGTPLAGSEAFGGTAAKAFDGNLTSSFWAGAVGAVAAGTSWVYYDFGVGVDIDIVQVGIVSRSSPDNEQVWDSFKLQWSSDGMAWTDVQTWTDTSSWASNQLKKFTV